MSFHFPLQIDQAVGQLGVGTLQAHNVLPHGIRQVDLIQLLLWQQPVIALHHQSGHANHSGIWWYFL